LPAAWNEKRDDELLWEAATRLASLATEDVRVIFQPAPAFLLCEEWDVELLDQWSVRVWERADDAYYESARELWALPKTGTNVPGEETSNEEND